MNNTGAGRVIDRHILIHTQQLWEVENALNLPAVNAGTLKLWNRAGADRTVSVGGASNISTTNDRCICHKRETSWATVMLSSSWKDTLYDDIIIMLCWLSHNCLTCWWQDISPVILVVIEHFLWWHNSFDVLWVTGLSDVLIAQDIDDEQLWCSVGRKLVIMKQLLVTLCATIWPGSHNFGKSKSRTIVHRHKNMKLDVRRNSYGNKYEGQVIWGEFANRLYLVVDGIISCCACMWIKEDQLVYI